MRGKVLVVCAAMSTGCARLAGQVCLVTAMIGCGASDLPGAGERGWVQQKVEAVGAFVNGGVSDPSKCNGMPSIQTASGAWKCGAPVASPDNPLYRKSGVGFGPSVPRGGDAPGNTYNIGGDVTLIKLAPR